MKTEYLITLFFFHWIWRVSKGFFNKVIKHSLSFNDPVSYMNVLCRLFDFSKYRQSSYHFHTPKLSSIVPKCVVIKNFRWEHRDELVNELWSDWIMQNPVFPEQPDAAKISCTYLNDALVSLWELMRSYQVIRESSASLKKIA